jgi:hypothetical protein
VYVCRPVISSSGSPIRITKFPFSEVVSTPSGVFGEVVTETRSIGYTRS